MPTRRELVVSVAGMTGLAALGSAPVQASKRSSLRDQLDAFIREKMERDHIPGVAVCLFSKEGIRWLGTYGWANLERRITMTADALQNICSISKTFTTTALMQQWEAGKFQLDDDVSGYLPFQVRNPSHPSAKVTFRNLLTHRSSIRDGSAYARRYRCGDSDMALADWMRSYFVAGGVDYDRAENFHPWAPGGAWDYCNVAYGLIAYLTERMAGVPFATYCKDRIFAVLDMPETSWYLADIDTSRHVTPYTYIAPDGKVRGPSWGGVDQGVIREAGATGSLKPGLQPNCLYNHPNYPDGFLRTSVVQLSRYARAYLHGGALGNRRVLSERTVNEMLTPQFTEGQRVQGLTWYASAKAIRGRRAWGHGGSDPGINTDLRIIPEEGIGAIAFMNTNGVRPDQITEQVLLLAPEF